MARGADLEKLVGPLEAEVMRALWKGGAPMSVRELLDVLNARRKHPLAYTTVMTVTSRLADKHLLTRRREGRSYLYEPTAEDAAALAVQTVMRDFGDAAVAHFVEQAREDPKLRRRLERMLDE